MTARNEDRAPSGWRGGRPKRIEALTDTVFGFSIALLIVSVEVPADFAALLHTMRGFAGFALSFAMLILVWLAGFSYFLIFPAQLMNSRYFERRKPGKRVASVPRESP